MKEKLEEIRRKIMPDGKAMILAYDQGFEHGPREFLARPECGNFEYILDIAIRGRFPSLALAKEALYSSELHLYPQSRPYGG